jgi:hypothetical protein
MTQWYLSYDGKQQGPYDLAQARSIARTNPNGHCWREGFTGASYSQVAELNQDVSQVMPRQSRQHQGQWQMRLILR